MAGRQALVTEGGHTLKQRAITAHLWERTREFWEKHNNKPGENLPLQQQQMSPFPCQSLLSCNPMGQGQGNDEYLLKAPPS